MEDFILAVVTSATMSTIITCLFNFVTRKLEYNQKKKEREEAEVKAFFAKKQEVYAATLERLLLIRNLFDYTCDGYQSAPDELLDDVARSNQEFMKIRALLRLYATDSIFREYSELSMCSRFALAPSSGPRLMENGKWAFETRVNLLAQHMQEDLGIRRYQVLHDEVACPECHTVHDINKPCPNCGMSYEEFLHRLNHELHIEYEYPMDQLKTSQQERENQKES